MKFMIYLNLELSVSYWQLYHLLIQILYSLYICFLLELESYVSLHDATDEINHIIYYW